MKQAGLIATGSAIALLVAGLALFLLSITLFASGHAGAAARSMAGAELASGFGLGLFVLVMGSAAIYAAATSSIPGAASSSERTVARFMFLAWGMFFVGCSIWIFVLVAREAWPFNKAI